MGVKFVRQIMGDDMGVQMEITQSIASSVDDSRKLPEYKQLYMLMRHNPLFRALVISCQRRAFKTAKKIMAIKPKEDAAELGVRCLMASAAEIFFCGITMGARVAADAFTSGFDAKGAPLASGRDKAKAILEEIMAQGKSDSRGFRFPGKMEDGGIDGYMARIAREVFPEIAPDETLGEEAIPAPDDRRVSVSMDVQGDDPDNMPPELLDIVKGFRDKGMDVRVSPALKIGPDGKLEGIDGLARQFAEDFIARHKAKSEQQPTFAQAEQGGHNKDSCDCRAGFMALGTAKNLEGLMDANVKFFPSAIADAVSVRAKALGLTGPVGALDVSSGAAGGRGELAVEIGKQPAIIAMAEAVAMNTVAMAHHGRNVTKDDTVSIVSAFLGATLAFCITDLVKPGVAN